MNQSIARDHPEFVRPIKRFAPELSAGAFDDQTAGSDVPQVHGAFDVSVQTSGGDVGQAQCSGAEHTDLQRAAREPGEVGKPKLKAAAAFGKADRDDALAKLASAADANFFSVQERRPVSRRGPEFIDEWIEDDAEHGV